MRRDKDAARLAPGLARLVGASGLEGYPTPLVAIDLDAMERNIAKMQRFFDHQPAGLRPHVKTHKCTEIALLQVAAGAVGVTCSTTDEVAAMVAAGIPDVLLANVVTDPLRLRALARSARIATVTAAVDSRESVTLLSSAAEAAETSIGVVLECDIGMGRNGVTDMSAALDIATQIQHCSRLLLRGVMAYEGHLISLVDREERARAATAAFHMPLALLRELRARGFEAPMLTGGSTATYDSSGAIPEMTDVQAGTYVLMDATYRTLVSEFELAVVIVATVSTVRPGGNIVLNVGAKRIATDWGEPVLLGFAVEHLYTAEEHSVFRHLDGPLPEVGERVAVLPGHVCTTMSMYSIALGCRESELERVLEIDSRDPLA